MWARAKDLQRVFSIIVKWLYAVNGFFKIKSMNAKARNTQIILHVFLKMHNQCCCLKIKSLWWFKVQEKQYKVKI